jgi:hypothetical protein
MKKVIPFIVVLLTVSMFSVVAMAASVEGSVQGFTCVTQGKVCPVGQEDPMIAAENVFVVLTAAMKFYFVPNLDRGIMARHINEKVKVEGKMSGTYNAITATALYTWRDGNWNKVWDEAMQRIVFEDLGIGIPSLP